MVNLFHLHISGTPLLKTSIQLLPMLRISPYMAVNSFIFNMLFVLSLLQTGMKPAPVY